MTLTTHIRVVEPTPVKPIFDECRRLLNGQTVPFTHEPERYGPHYDNPALPPNMTYRNEIGQGLYALLWVTYGSDGPLTDYPHESGETDDDACSCPPKASIKVSFDTTYGYRAPNGAGCADLHAWLIVELGRWLDARDLTWYWENEFTGEWHKGNDSATALWEFGNPIKGCVSQDRRPNPCHRPSHGRHTVDFRSQWSWQTF